MLRMSFSTLVSLAAVEALSFPVSSAIRMLPFVKGCGEVEKSTFAGCIPGKPLSTCCALVWLAKNKHDVAIATVRSVLICFLFWFIIKVPRNINVFFLQNNSKTPIMFFLNILFFGMISIKYRLAADLNYVVYTRMILCTVKNYNPLMNPL